MANGHWNLLLKDKTMTEKRYTNNEITIVWKPDTCIHAKLCWNGLGEVFNPRERPWINMDGATTEKIVEQINKCPSGALSYFHNSEGEQTEVETETIAEVMENGPLLVYGNITVKDSQGNETKKHKVTAFCRCGASSNKPFCDGGHKKVDFKG